MTKKDEEAAGGRQKNIADEPGRFMQVLVFFFRTFVGLTMAAVGAVLLVLAFSPYKIWPLIFCGLVPILISVHRVMSRRIAGLAMGLAVGGFFWFFYRGVDGGTGTENLVYLPYVLGFIGLLIGSRQRAFHTRSHYRWFVIEGAATWVAFELIRGYFLPLGTSAFLANSLYEQYWLIQPVSIFSIYGMSFIIVLCNLALTQKAMALIDSRWAPQDESAAVSRVGSQFWLYTAFLLFLLWAGYSMALFGDPPPALRVAAIQPGYYQHHPEVGGEILEVTRETIEFQEDLEQLLDITRKAVESGAQLVVWNEAALPFNPQHKGMEIFQDYAKEMDTFLVVGYHDPEEKINDAVILSSDGVFLGKTYETLIGNLGIVDTREINFTRGMRELTREETRIFAVPSNEPYELASRHLAHYVFRAIENRTPIIKADAHHVSGIIDPFGKIIQFSLSTEPRRKILMADIPIGTGNTPVVVWGDWFGWLCLAVAAVFGLTDLIISYKEGQKRKKAREEEREKDKKKGPEDRKYKSGRHHLKLHS